MKKILLTGGGSGGHIFPLIAIAQQLKRLANNQKIDLQIRYYGPQDIYSGYILKENIAVKKIWSSKLRRYWSWSNLIDFPIFFVSILQSLWKIFWYMPDVAFSKGGPGALPVLFACHFYRVPIIIHESDAIPGLTNLISGRWAKLIEVSFPNSKKYFSGKNTRLSGQPVRQEIIDSVSMDPAIAKEMLGLNPKTPLILIIGGSLGATRLNQFVLKNILILLSRYQVIHQTGTANFDEYQREFKKISRDWPRDIINRYQIFAFFEKNLKEILVASDLIISRAGAGAIFEIATLGKPAILIPYPESANGHQKENAYTYSKTGAATVVEENNLDINIILAEIEKMISNPKQQQNIRLAAQKFSQPQAAKIIAQDILDKKISQP